MKGNLLVVLSLVAVVVLATMGSNLLGVQTAAAKSSRVAVSTPIAPRAVNINADGEITIWSNAPSFTSPKTEPFHTSARVVQGSVQGNWNITIAKLSIPWSSKTQLTLQNGKVASGVFQSPANTMRLTIPLQGLPVVNTTTFNVSTAGSVNTTDGQTISGIPVDPKGDTTLVGSKSFTVLIASFQAQVRIQCKLSPWPLPVRL